jgi:membrane-bound inhibitor of C-type lysozyme
LFRAVAAVVTVAAVAALAGCAGTPSKEEQEAAKNTFTCQLDGERLVIRFDAGEARLLTSAGERIVLYQIAAASGVRYSNGKLELRGKGMELQLVRDANATQLTDCQPYTVPK